MPASGFATSVRRQAGVSIVDLSGEIDAGAEDSLKAAYDEAAAGNGASILLNFGDVDYINRPASH